MSYPLEKLEALVLLNSVQLSSQCVSWLLEKGIPVTWLSATGKFYGRLEPTTHINIERQREQFRRAEDSLFRKRLAIKLIQAKINNSRVVLRRYNRERNLSEVKTLIDNMGIYQEKCGRACHVEQLISIEGAAAKLYFKGLAMLISEPFRFNGRTKQPPRDYFNSLLSLTYTLLMYDFYTTIVNRGLHPYMGYLHKIRSGHSALASDLMEEWRPVIADSLVFSLVSGGIIQTSDFLPADKNGGIYLDRKGAKKLIMKYEEKMRRKNKYLSKGGFGSSFRESLEIQVSGLIKAIENNDPDEYTPILIR